MHLKGKLRDTRNPLVVPLGFGLKPVKFLSDELMLEFDLF